MAAWERRKILIWGKTRPELSKANKEIVCTGGVFADTERFVRLYPIPLRYLDDAKVFAKYQWIEADVGKALNDPRPESYNVRPDTIVAGEKIPSRDGDWGRRAEWITQPRGHVFRSVEALQAAQELDGTSIGMVKPLTVSDFRLQAISASERNEFWAKYGTVLAQQDLPFESELERTVKPLPAPEFRFQIKFRCDDQACGKEHTFSIFDWEVDALYNRLRSEGDTPELACEKVIAKLRDEVCGEGRDTHFFLGNMRAHPQVFTIVGLWHPKVQPQRGLFDGT